MPAHPAPQLAPSPMPRPIQQEQGLIQQHVDFIRSFSEGLAEVARGSPTRVDLFSMIRTQMFLAGTSAAYGNRSRYTRAGVRVAWLIFDAILPDPRRLFPESEWFHLTRSLNEKSKATFWMLHWIISDHRINADCLRDLHECLRQRGTAVLLNLEPHCPVFRSTLLEVLRFMDEGVFASTDIWGERFDEFDHLRFARGGLVPAGIRWAMGSQFVRRHMHPLTLALVALLLLRVDVRPSRANDVVDEVWMTWAELPEPGSVFRVNVTLRP